MAAAAQLDWLDVGCGTGALSDTVLRQAEPCSVTGIDSSPDFVAYAHAHITDQHTALFVGTRPDQQCLPVSAQPPVGAAVPARPR